MITIKFIAGGPHPERAAATITCKPGQSLMQAAVSANVPGIEADCGGLMTCSTCHVYVHEQWLDKLTPLDDAESAMLDFTSSPRRDNSRLSCQIILTQALDGLTVDLPETQH